MKASARAHIAPLGADDPRSKDPQIEELVQFVGYRPNALLTMARMPGVVPALLQLLDVTLRSDERLTPQFKFLIAAEAARGAKCQYTAAHLVHAAHHLGAPWEKLAALPSYLDSSKYTDRERAALKIASAGGVLPVREPALAMAAAKSVFSDEELIEIVACVAVAGWFNRWNSLMETELEPAPAEALDHVPWLSEFPARIP